MAAKITRTPQQLAKSKKNKTVAFVFLGLAVLIVIVKLVLRSGGN